MILPLPEREKFELELRDEILEHSDQRNISQYLRVDKSRISRQLDPNRADCVSPSYQFLEWLWAMDAKDPAKGEKMLEQITRERNNYLVNVRKRNANSSDLTTGIFESATDFLKTETSDGDIPTLLNKIEKVRVAVENKADDLKLRQAKKKGLIT